MQNAIIGYVLTLAVFMPVSGFLSDKFGNKKILISVEGLVKKFFDRLNMTDVNKN